MTKNTPLRPIALRLSMALLPLITVLTGCSSGNMPDGTVSQEVPPPASPQAEGRLLGWLTVATGVSEDLCNEAEMLASDAGFEVVACFNDRFGTGQVRALLAAGPGNDERLMAMTSAKLHVMEAVTLNEALLSDTTGLFIMVRHPVKGFEHWHRVFRNMDYYKELDSIYTVGVFIDAGDGLMVSVLSHSASRDKAARYAKLLEEGRILEASGVLQPVESTVLSLNKARTEG